MRNNHEINETAREYIEKVTAGAENIMDLFSAKVNDIYDQKKYKFEKCRKICRMIKIAVFSVCMVIIYLHFRR